MGARRASLLGSPRPGTRRSLPATRRLSGRGRLGRPARVGREPSADRAPGAQPNVGRPGRWTRIQRISERSTSARHVADSTPAQPRLPSHGSGAFLWRWAPIARRLAARPQEGKTDAPQTLEEDPIAWHSIYSCGLAGSMTACRMRAPFLVHLHNSRSSRGLVPGAPPRTRQTAHALAEG